MKSILEPVSAVAVWGSLGASLVLSVSMLIQGIYDPARRKRFLFVSAVAALICVLDLLYSRLSPFTYELCRVFLWPLYALSVINLFQYSVKIGAVICSAISMVGVLVWIFINPNLATTAVLPLSFATAAWVHLQQYKKVRGYSSCILAVSSIAQAFMCALFFTIVSLGNPLFFALGYLHYAVISILATLEGWVHLPREMRGRAPVKVEPQVAMLFACLILSAELIILPGLLLGEELGVQLYVIGTVVQLVGIFALFFRQRNLLVIFTDNVSALLAERTESLEDARLILSHQNMLQAQQLEDQARAIKEKSEVIERQRRLELAAQSAGQAAHDIQNLLSPMTSYIGALEAFIEKTPQSITPLSRLKRAVSELLDLNQQLLSLSRRGRVEKQPIALTELCDEIQSRFPSRLKLIMKDSDLWVEGAWSQVMRAVSNVVQNGIEVSPQTLVSLTVRREKFMAPHTCHLGYVAPGEYIAIDISDKGNGISTSEIGKIFEPFYSSKTSKRSSGSGLGLAVVAAVMADHKGGIEVQTSELGTTFTLLLPEFVRHESRQSLKGGETILLIDDDPGVHAHLTKPFAELGYKVLSVFDGAEALKLLSVEKIDGVVLDLNMPKLSGIEALVGFMHVRRGLVSVIYSSYVDKSSETESYMYGAHAVISKPANPEVIIRSLREGFARVSEKKTQRAA